MASEIRNIQKTDSVRIQDGMCSTQLPAKLIVSADTVLGEMCRRGNTSPELRVYYGTKGGLRAWYCDWGAFSCWSSTPWGAIDNLARQLKELTGEPKGQNRQMQTQGDVRGSTLPSVNELEERPVSVPGSLPLCHRCNDTGRDDSGGTYEWGETIYVKCECQEGMPYICGCGAQANITGYCDDCLGG